MPSEEQQLDLMIKVNEMYIRHSIPDFLQTYDRDVWRIELKKLKEFIKMDSSPGVPYHFIGSTNEKVFEEMGDDLYECILDRIETRLSLNDKIIEMSRIQRIEKGICDPVRVFVKDEPHKVSKLVEGRVRLIMSVSIVDKMIEMLLSRHLHKLEIMNWMVIPSKPGIGFTRDMNKWVYEEVMEAGNMAYADISGWDWSCKPWLMELSAKAKIALCDNPSQVWAKLVLLEPVIEAESVYQFSDGEMVMPRFRGIVNSGKYKTSRDNSWMRVCLATLIGAHTTIAAGDDTVEGYVENAKEKYLDLGWVLKDYVRVREGFEFCSRWYSFGYSYPLNIDKMLMNLLHTRPKGYLELDMMLLQFTDQLEDHPEFPDIIEFIYKLGYGQELEGAQ